MSDSHDLSGKVVVITGGGSGVGRATALALVQAGAVPVLLGRSAAPLSEALDRITDAGGTGLAVPADVANEEVVTNAFAKAAATTHLLPSVHHFEFNRSYQIPTYPSAPQSFVSIHDSQQLHIPSPSY